MIIVTSKIKPSETSKLNKAVFWLQSSDWLHDLHVSCLDFTLAHLESYSYLSNYYFVTWFLFDSRNQYKDNILQMSTFPRLKTKHLQLKLGITNFSPIWKKIIISIWKEGRFFRPLKESARWAIIRQQGQTHRTLRALFRSQETGLVQYIRLDESRADAICTKLGVLGC